MPLLRTRHMRLEVAVCSNDPLWKGLFRIGSGILRMNFSDASHFRPKDSASKRWQAIADSHTPASGRNGCFLFRRTTVFNLFLIFDF